MRLPWTGKPIVSTALPDVESNFADVVEIARSHQEFKELCQRMTSQHDQDAVQRGLKMARENTWDAIVAQLENHLQAAIRTQRQKNDGVSHDGVSRNGALYDGALHDGVGAVPMAGALIGAGER